MMKRQVFNINKQQTNMKAEKIIVGFHTGRGGRHYNQGHVKFLGECTIGKFTNELFNRYEYEENILNQYEDEEVRENISELIFDEDFEELEAKYNISKESLGEIQYYHSGSGSDVGLTQSDVDKGTGTIDIDGGYNTTTCCYLSECDESTIKLIEDWNGWNSKELIQCLKQHLNIIEDEE